MTRKLAAYCPSCGAKTSQRFIDGRNRRYCSICDEIIWQDAAVGTSVIVFSNRQVLLIKRGKPPDVGKWAIPGGFVDANEPPVVGAIRELQEETNLEIPREDMNIFDICHDESDGEYYLSIGFLIRKEFDINSISPGDDAQKAKFWGLEEVLNSKSEIWKYDLDRLISAFNELYSDSGNR